METLSVNVEKSLDVTIDNQQLSSFNMEKVQRLDSTVSCMVCGHVGVRLGKHIRSKHNMNTDLYLNQYPDALLVAPADTFKLNKARSEFVANLSLEGRVNLLNNANNALYKSDGSSRRIRSRWNNDHERMTNIVVNNLSKRTEDSFKRIAEGSRLFWQTERGKALSKENSKYLIDWYNTLDEEDKIEFLSNRNESIKLAWQNQTDQQKYDRVSPMLSKMFKRSEHVVGDTTYFFRSFLEQTTAVRLFNAGLDFKYEEVVLKYNNSRFLPDFYLPTHNTLLEVKGNWSFNKDYDKLLLISSLAEDYGFNYIVLVYNDQNNYLNLQDLLSVESKSGLRVFTL